VHREEKEAGEEKMNDKESELPPEEELHAVQETLYLMSLPGMSESIKEGLKTPIEDCDEEAGLSSSG
jgi:PHD/YefM family antitoxin component YafN of YafNO toxin-antitoxin module